MSASRRPADLSMLPSRERMAEQVANVEAAAAILAVHAPDAGGACAGCMALWGRWIYFEDCPQVRWAREVVEALTVGADEQAGTHDQCGGPRAGLGAQVGGSTGSPPRPGDWTAGASRAASEAVGGPARAVHSR